MEKAAERARQTKVLDAMAEKLKDGPLGLLVECYEKRGRVLVWTRHAHGIRGTLVGFLLAVDKHFNMVVPCLLHFTRKNSTTVWRLVHLHQFFVCHAHHLVLSFMIRSRKWGEDCWWQLHFYSLLSHPSPVRPPFWDKVPWKLQEL
jgi:lysylphosphatidylglycerol synthetase-like protein (DUF2156 family)